MKFAQVAEERPSSALPFAIHYISLLGILCHINLDFDKMDLLEDYNVVCPSMFEVTVIAPPSNNEDSCAVDCGSNATCHHVFTRKGGTHLCTTDTLVQISKLRLTLVVSRKTSSLPFLTAHLCRWLLYFGCHGLDGSKASVLDSLDNLKTYFGLRTDVS